MKKQRLSMWLAAILILCMLFALMSGCNQNGDTSADTGEPENTASEGTEETSSGDTESNPFPISETAMQNFLTKIGEGNYAMNASGYLKTTAHSKDLVYFDFADEGSYSDFAVMSVNGEVFQGRLTDDGVTDVAFIKEGTALDAAGRKLPNYWLSDALSKGNIYNLFYNDTVDPLKFVSYDENLKKTVLSYVGYGETALKSMHEVYLTLDQEDPTAAHLQALMDDDEVARIYWDDIDILITFGNTVSDSRADAWMQDPVYPEARTEWSEADIFIFNSVFLPGYGEAAVPFLPFASYALYINQDDFVFTDSVEIRDSHASEEDLDEYIAILTQNGFSAVTEDGRTCYRRLLREETRCYSSIYLEYDSGLNLTAEKYYEFPVYDGLDDINGVITANGYPALPATDDLTGFHATDTRDEQTESWLYFYDYKTVLYVNAHFTDHDKAAAYLESYAEELLRNGYTPSYADGDAESEIDLYESQDGSASFRYHFDDSDPETVTLLFKAEKCLSASEAQAILEREGFPKFDFSAYVTGRDHTRFEKVMYGKTYKSATTMTMTFESSEKAEAFLDELVKALEAAGFLRTPPSDLGSNKTNGYTNEATAMGVAFDLYPDEDTGEASIFFDFKSGIEFDTEE